MNAAPMTSIGEAERRRLDPLSMPDPRAFTRWRELQKMGAQKFEEGTYREEKVKMQEALGHPDLTDEQRVEAMTEAIDEAEAAVGFHASGVHEYWTARTIEKRDLLQEQLACIKALRGAIKAISKFRLRRSLKRAHDAKLNSANCPECAEAKEMLQLLQREEGAELYSSEEDCPKMTPEEVVAFRLQFHEADYVPDAPVQPKPVKERQEDLKIVLDADMIEPKIETHELLYLEELRDSTQFDDPKPGWVHKKGWSQNALRREPQAAFGVTVFFSQFNGSGSLTELHLDDNRLTGPLPQQLGECCPSLQVLRLARNRISGTIPASMCLCKSLREVDLSCNMLYGSVPGDIDKCMQLNVLILNHNRLSGDLPHALLECRMLSALGLKKNFFTAEQRKEIADLFYAKYAKRVYVSV